MLPPPLSSSAISAALTSGGSLNTSGLAKRRRDSFDSLGRAVQANQAALLQQQQAGVHHQAHGSGSAAGGLAAAHAFPQISPSTTPAPGSPLRPVRTSASPSAARLSYPPPAAAASSSSSSFALPPHHNAHPQAHAQGHHAHHYHPPVTVAPPPHAGASSSSYSHDLHAAAPTPIDFPFPNLSSLNRSRLLHLLDYQIRLSNRPADAHATKPSDPDSAAHLSVLASAIRGLFLGGGIFNFSFVAGTSVADELLGRPRKTELHFSGATRAGVMDGRVATRLSSLHLLECLAAIRESPSATLAQPSELPPQLLDAGIFYVPDRDAVHLLSPYVYHRALALLSFLLNLHLHHLVLSRLLHLIGLIDRPLSYWLAHQDISSLPKPYRLWKFLRWKWARRGSSAAAQAQQALQDGRLNPYRNWSAMAARNVRELLALKNRWVARCGRIAVRMHRIQDWLQDSFSKSAVPPQQPATGGRFAPPAAGTAAPAPLFHHQISLNQRYFGKLYGYIVREEMQLPVAHDEHAAHFASPTSPLGQGHPSVSMAAAAAGATSIEGKILALQTQLASYDSFLVHLESHFTPWFESEIERRKQPHHLWEWWHVYAGVGAVAAAGAVLMVRHRQRVQAGIRDAWAALGEFMYEHAAEPISNIYNNIFSTFHDRSLFSTNHNTLTQSKDNLAAMLTNFASAHASEMAQHENKPMQQFVDSIPQRASSGDMDLVMKTYQREIQRPILSLLFGDLMRGLLIQVQKVKIDTEAAMLAADQVLRSNEINFNLIATMPVLLLSYLAADFANKWILRGSWSSKKVRAKVRQSKAILSELEQLYILHLPSMQLKAGAGAVAAAASRARPHVHAQFESLSVEEFASLASQEAEAEDEALRLSTPRAGDDDRHDAADQPNGADSSRRPPAHARFGSELFSGSAHSVTALAAGDDEDEEAVDSDEESGEELVSPRSAQSGDGFGSEGFGQRGGHNGMANPRTLFAPSQLVPSPSSSSSSSAALGLNNRAYGRSLLLVFQLSQLLSSLPLASALTSSLTGVSGGPDSSPRLVLQRDLILLASQELTPDQKLRWLQHMKTTHEFLRL